MKYLIKRRKSVKGPFSKDELKKLNIKPECKVKSISDDKWIAAYKVEDLKDLFPQKPDLMIRMSLYTLLICFPFGILGLLRAWKIRSQYLSGRYTEARLLSRETRLWNKIGFACGLILYAIIALFRIANLIKVLLTES